METRIFRIDIPNKTEKEEELQKLEERLVSLKKNLRNLEAEADSLEEARKMIHAQTLIGKETVSKEAVRATGELKIATGTGNTLEEAVQNARLKVPVRTQVIRETVLAEPAQQVIIIEASDEKEARLKAQGVAALREEVKQCHQVIPGRAGFLGLFRKPAQYMITLGQDAAVEIVAKGRASIQATVGEKSIVDEIASLEHRILGLKEVILKSGAPEISSSPVSHHRY